MFPSGRFYLVGVGALPRFEGACILFRTAIPLLPSSSPSYLRNRPLWHIYLTSTAYFRASRILALHVFITTPKQITA